MVTAIVSTDWHLNYPMWQESMTRLLLDFVDNQVAPKKPDMFIHLGDVFHNVKPSGDAIELATILFKKLSECCGEVFIIPGNHEMDRYQQITAVDFLDDLAGNIHIVHEIVNQNGLLFVPYYRKVPKLVREAIKKAQYVFAHLGCEAAPMTDTKLYGKRPDSLSIDDIKDVLYAFLGHVHRPFNEGGLYIVGSPYQLKFNDPFEGRGYVVIKNIEGIPKIKKYSYKEGFELKSIHLKMKQLSKVKLKSILPVVENNTFYKFLITYETLKRPTSIRDSRNYLQSIFGNALVESHIVSTVSPRLRSVRETVKHVLSPKSDVAPEELLEQYLIYTGGGFFQKNPEIVQLAKDEFRSVISLCEVK